ncbi:hypothetical protein CK203_081174 [Vitis vinifera]|uniref:Retrotransposon gag domain-containing protein n=1 Tax=Vitis vinifera TaxID=29760 RepID=A0A438ER99_VITVI|nr:hypothetical protein CK203_081174 [Vitis vinifera]
MDTQQSRHVVLEDTSSDLVTPPVLPVQMPATQTLPTVSHDHAAVISPIVTPVTIIEDPRSRMDRLEQRIRQMRDPDEMISWDDPDDMPVATLPVGFRMPDIERYTGAGCPRIHLRLYSTVMRALGLDETQLLTLFPLSLSGATQRWYASLESSRRRTWEDLAQEFLRQEKAAEMIERPIERDQMSMFLRSLHPRGLWSDVIPSLDTEGKGVGGSSESYGDVCSADFQHRRPSYHPYARSLQIPRSDFTHLQHRHPHPVQQYPSMHPHAVTVRPSFQFQRPQTSIPRHEQSRPHRRRQRTYSDLGMPLDRAFERLRSTGVLVPLAPRPLPSYLASTFSCSRVLCISPDGRPPVLDSFSVVTGPRADIDGHPSSSRGASGVAMPSLPHLTSSTPATLGASHPRSRPHSVFQAAFLIHFTGYADTTSAPVSGPSGRYSSSGSISSPSTMSETLFRFERTPEQSF